MTIKNSSKTQQIVNTLKYKYIFFKYNSIKSENATDFSLFRMELITETLKNQNQVIIS